jgi:hypothetical protein
VTLSDHGGAARIGTMRSAEAIAVDALSLPKVSTKSTMATPRKLGPRKWQRVSTPSGPPRGR